MCFVGKWQDQHYQKPYILVIATAHELLYPAQYVSEFRHIKAGACNEVRFIVHSSVRVLCLSVRVFGFGTLRIVFLSLRFFESAGLC